MNYAKVTSLIESPDGNSQVISKYQSTKDIIKDLIYCFKNYNYQSVPVARQYSTGNIKTDAKKIYDFIKENINYEAEPEKDQTTRSFSRIIFDKTGDCKHNALIAGSIAWNMGYNVFFKFVSYEKGTTYGHVYTIIQDPETKEKYIIDPLQVFNTEKPYFKALTAKAYNHKNTNKMTLSRLSGIEQDLEIIPLSGDEQQHYVEGLGLVNFTNMDELSGIGKKKGKIKTALAKHAEKKAEKTPKHILKKAVTKLKTNAKKHGGIVKTVALAPIRAAGSVLFLANFRGFASRFLKLPLADQQGFTKKFGYKYDTLISQVNKGAKKKPVFGEKVSGTDQEIIRIDGIGVVAVTTAAVTASPLILVLMNLFKKSGIVDASDSKSITAAAEGLKQVSDIAEQATSVVKQASDITTDIATATATATNTELPQTTLKERPGVETSESFFDKVKASAQENPVLWFGGGAIVLFVAGKKLKLF